MGAERRHVSIGEEKKWNCLWITEGGCVLGGWGLSCLLLETGQCAGHHAEDPQWNWHEKEQDSWSGSGVRAPYIQQTEWRSGLTKVITFLRRAPQGSHISRWLLSLLFYTHLGSFLEFSTKGSSSVRATVKLDSLSLPFLHLWGGGKIAFLTGSWKDQSSQSFVFLIHVFMHTFIFFIF